MITLFSLLSGVLLKHSLPIDIGDDKTIGQEEESALRVLCTAELAVYSISIPAEAQRA
jgi:hypothetical protein